jgi:phosphoribosylaminoimidazolecarboxamide formyltransferase / IMP cyclohydrolase
LPDAHRAALLSLSETTGAADLARAIAECGIALIATSGTKAFLAREGIEARDVEELTGVPPLFDGRVKTLHPTIFGAILYERDRPEHRDEARRRDIPEIAIVAVTLYPPPEIDIGGVALLRAAAKNFSHVSVLCDPTQYASFIAALGNGGPTLEERRALAAAALHHTATYDERNAAALCRGTQTHLRYGENPHQRATFTAARDAVPEQLHGKALSYNNLLDLDAALRLLARNAPADEPSLALARAVIVKHTIPCGVAQRVDVAEALRLALDADPTSAYGGIVAVDAPLTAGAATVLADVFLEIVAAPAFADEALALLRRKRNLRIMRFLPALPQRLAGERSLRSALGGVLAEEPNPAAPAETMRIVSRRQPTGDEWRDLRFAWDVVAHVKSNGIVVARDGVTRGICAGQTNRVSAVEIATGRAGANARCAACASDGFFPFADGLQAAISAGCSAVIAPGGSIRDDEVIAAADAAGVALVFSSYRYFLH